MLRKLWHNPVTGNILYIALCAVALAAAAVFTGWPPDKTAEVIAVWGLGGAALALMVAWLAHTFS